MSNRAKRHRPRRSTPAARDTGTPSPWPKRILVGAGAAVGLVLVVLVAFQPQPRHGVPDGTETVPVGPGTHVETAIYRPDEVPAGGAHSPVWQNCGFYDSPIRAENAVHSLEHGAVWITYRPDDIDGTALRRFTGRRKVIVSPVPGQQDPLVATAWGRRLTPDSPDDPRLEQFVNEFAGAASAPEPGGRCSGGVGEPSS